MKNVHPASKLRRAEIAGHTRRVLRQGVGVQSSVYLVEIGGERAAVKDYASCPLWFGRLIAPYLLRREWRALKALEGLPGVPRVYGRPDSRSLAMEYIEGSPLDTFGMGELEPEVFGRVQDAVDAIHNRGVSHCDLKRRSNLLLTPQGEIYLIDFAAAVIGKRRLRPVSNWVQKQMALIDDKSMPRLKHAVAPELLTEEDRYKLEHPTGLEKWGRKLLNR